MPNFTRLITALSLIILLGAWPQQVMASTAQGIKLYRQGNYQAAMSLLKPRAEAGDREAQAYLGFMYERGKGVGKDMTMAVYWYRSSADRGHRVSQFNLGVLYEGGRGVRQSDTKALKWYKKSAAQGMALAQYNLATFYANGRGTAKNAVKAAEWMRKAAEQGALKAQYWMGEFYRRGRGVPQNYGKAVYWLKKAAKRGHARAQNTLGVRYVKGQGVAQSFLAASSWFKKATGQGLSKAQFNLGYLYEIGRGVSRSKVQAYRWYLLAGKQGYQKANKRRDMLAAEMSSSQIESAYHLAKMTAPKQVKRAIANARRWSKSDYLHKVRYPEETLFKIVVWYSGTAKHLGDLAGYNGLNAKSAIRIGQVIRIPRKLMQRTKPMPASYVRRSANRPPTQPQMPPQEPPPPQPEQPDTLILDPAPMH